MGLTFKHSPGIFKGLSAGHVFSLTWACFICTITCFNVCLGSGTCTYHNVAWLQSGYTSNNSETTNNRRWNRRVLESAVVLSCGNLCFSFTDLHWAPWTVCWSIQQVPSNHSSLCRAQRSSQLWSVMISNRKLIGFEYFGHVDFRKRIKTHAQNSRCNRFFATKIKSYWKPTNEIHACIWKRLTSTGQDLNTE